MKHNDMFKIVKELEFDKEKIIFEEDNIELFIIRPSVLPKRLKNTYDLKKNFQIWLKEGERKFRPNTTLKTKAMRLNL